MLVADHAKEFEQAGASMVALLAFEGLHGCDEHCESFLSTPVEHQRVSSKHLRLHVGGGSHGGTQQLICVSGAATTHQPNQ